ncbi:hypothetical protein SEA_TRAX_134 [Gordonia phage Trax]|uniref:Uncharacterized protein n=1 Tax=Gordonia phage Trax TaxID=2591121 RepID=A0A515MHH6_9CAUD|nr:hypothetical protein L3Y20_gp098 [Gordonia phage Trax]QDM56014.1 hypothetical protein SEA_TRAX_134 [Gordonia phage Trax]
MTNTVASQLIENMESAKARLQAYAEQIESGVYVTRESVIDLSAYFGASFFQEAKAWMERKGWDEAADFDPSDEFAADALDEILESYGMESDEGAIWERTEHDEPTVDETPISEFGLDLVIKIGRPIELLITVGGPYIAVEHDLSENSARLVGAWGGDKHTLHDASFETVLDYLTEGTLDEIRASSPNLLD